MRGYRGARESKALVALFRPNFSGSEPRRISGLRLPLLYIIFLPAVGLVSMMVTALARTPLFDYRLIVLAFTATGFISVGLWAHRMFSTGRAVRGNKDNVAAGSLRSPLSPPPLSFVALVWQSLPALLA